MAIVALSILPTDKVHAKDLSESEVDRAEDQARKTYIDRFSKFTQDKNVMGKSTTPDGKNSGGGKKTRFNRDDGSPFQSDLTYHDNTFNLSEKAGQDQQGNEKQRTLFAFVSEHGKVSQAGGSSLLERTVYSLHERFSKQEEDAKQAKQEDEQKGIKFRSVFKIETRDVFDKNAKNGQNQQQQAQGDKNGDNDKEKVERVTLRDEANPEVRKVGDESFETIKRSGRDEGNEDDENTMPNMTFLREAAKRASEAMWNAALANLGQRRINRGIRAGSLPEKPQLSEDYPTCEEYANELNQQIAKVGKNQQLQQQLRQDLNRVNQQCKQMAKIDYKTVNPRFEQGEQQGGGGDAPETLKTGDQNKEDGIQRDLRVELTTWEKAGTKASEVPSNWKYDKKDDEVTLTNYDEKGEAQGDRTITVQDFFDGYNKQLDDAQKGYEGVAERTPIQVPNLSEYYLAPKQSKISEINAPTASQMEELGQEEAVQAPTATNYDELVKQQAQ